MEIKLEPVFTVRLKPVSITEVLYLKSQVFQIVYCLVIFKKIQLKNTSSANNSDVIIYSTIPEQIKVLEYFLSQIVRKQNFTFFIAYSTVTRIRSDKLTLILRHLKYQF